MSVRLFLKDNINGTVHEYGTDEHDSLVLQDDGSLHYYNLQNGTGTKFPEEGYSFCRADGSLLGRSYANYEDDIIDTGGDYYDD